MNRSPRKESTVLLLAGALSIAMATHADEADKAELCSISNTGDKEAWKRDCDAAIQAESDPAKKAELYFLARS